MLTMLEQNSSQLEKNSEKVLVSLVNHLSSRIEELESYRHVSLLQYVRRKSIEIHDFPETVADDELEKTCLSYLQTMGRSYSQ